MKMKQVLYTAQLLLFTSAAFWSSHSVANGIVKGKVEFVRTHTTPEWAPPIFWFTLKGVTNVGSCHTWVGGRVIFVAKDSQSLNLVMAAVQGNKEIA